LAIYGAYQLYDKGADWICDQLFEVTPEVKAALPFEYQCILGLTGMNCFITDLPSSDPLTPFKPWDPLSLYMRSIAKKRDSLWESITGCKDAEKLTISYLETNEDQAKKADSAKGVHYGNATPLSESPQEYVELDRENHLGFQFRGVQYIPDPTIPINFDEMIYILYVILHDADLDKIWFNYVPGQDFGTTTNVGSTYQLKAEVLPKEFIDTEFARCSRAKDYHLKVVLQQAMQYFLQKHPKLLKELKSMQLAGFLKANSVSIERMEGNLTAEAKEAYLKKVNAGEIMSGSTVSELSKHPQFLELQKEINEMIVPEFLAQYSDTDESKIVRFYFSFIPLSLLLHSLGVRIAPEDIEMALTYQRRGQENSAPRNVFPEINVYDEFNVYSVAGSGGSSPSSSFLPRNGGVDFSANSFQQLLMEDKIFLRSAEVDEDDGNNPKNKLDTFSAQNHACCKCHFILPKKSRMIFDVRRWEEEEGMNSNVPKRTVVAYCTACYPHSSDTIKKVIPCMKDINQFKQQVENIFLVTQPAMDSSESDNNNNPLESDMTANQHALFYLFSQFQRSSSSIILEKVTKKEKKYFLETLLSSSILFAIE
jgi:hypothetical protein